MARTRTVHRCTACGAEHPQWNGRCAGCDEWNTLVEEADTPAPTGLIPPSGSARPIDEVGVDEGRPVATGIAELDRVLGGGLVPGSVTLVGGEPGVGKSTLLLQVAGKVAEEGRKVLYISAEEAAAQVRARAERLGTLEPGLLVSAESAIPHLVGLFEEHDPDLVIVDSIQTVFEPDLASAPGTVAQVRACAQRLTGEAKRRGTAVVLVGHVTKEGALAGPRVLEHLVDTVLNFEGDRHHVVRLLRAAKHRFGSTQELGVFEMTGAGLVDVPDAGSYFLNGRQTGLLGSVVAASMDGHRPLLIEIQSLVSPGVLKTPKREAQGVDRGRLAMILAIIDRHVDFKLGPFDVYVMAAGGVKVTEPGVDLALAFGLVSCVTGFVVDPETVVVGELGLGGEVRPVAAIDRRLREAARLGFKKAVVPTGSPATDGIELVEVRDLKSALAINGMLDSPMHDQLLPGAEPSRAPDRPPTAPAEANELHRRRVGRQGMEAEQKFRDALDDIEWNHGRPRWGVDEDDSF
jgi:DNA repair protein RadA/Sms